MGLILLQNATAVAPNGSVPFEGNGGVAPYTYKILNGGIGGTISPDGVYQAPSVTGVDQILVTDSVNATAIAEIQICTPIELVCDILQSELGLPDGAVYLWDQKIAPRKDSQLYIAVSVLSNKVFGNSISTETTEDGLNTVQSVNMMSTLSIDIMSRGPDARDRKEEVILALRSMYAQQQQELNGFYIAPVSGSFVNLSQEDGAAIPYRFNISINIQYFVTKIKAGTYYDSFSQASYVTES